MRVRIALRGQALVVTLGKRVGRVALVDDATESTGLWFGSTSVGIGRIGLPSSV